MPQKRLPIQVGFAFVVLDVERRQPLLDVIQVLTRNLIDAVHFAIEIAEDDGHIKVLQVETNTFQVNDFNVAGRDDEGRELGEFNQARRRRQNAHSRLERHTLERELVVGRIEFQVQVREIFLPNLLHALGKVTELFLNFLLSLTLALLVFDFIRVVHVTTSTV